ncbi:hypothetical protein M5K25_001759 [Dendrobium thyrsiflorum]|uniref:Uncharacterized protein n=1 Tax=Dendrobium thyrsiflorum TaxID=117978 RepID=A0ABD0W102_DENTH
MGEHMRSYIRLIIEDSGSHLHTSMGNNTYNLIKVTKFSPFNTSAQMGKLYYSLKWVWRIRENLGSPNQGMKGSIWQINIHGFIHSFDKSEEEKLVKKKRHYNRICARERWRQHQPCDVDGWDL